MALTLEEQVTRLRRRVRELEARVDVLEGAEPPPPPPPGDSLATQIANTPIDGTLELPEGRMNDTAAVSKAMTIQGAGAGKTVIDATGLRPAYQKAVIVATVAGVKVRHLTLTGAAIAASDGGNAAGIRGEPWVSVDIANVEITGCQNGILSSGGTHLIDHCNIHHNGNGNPGAGNTHEIYITGVADRLSLTNSVVTCGSLATHAVKSRSGVTEIADCVLTGNGDDGTNGGAVVNTPDGGDLTITRTRLIRSASAGNHNMIQHASESASLGAGTVTLNEVTIEGGGHITGGGRGARLVIGTNCRYVGAAPDFSGWASVTGQFTAGG